MAASWHWQASPDGWQAYDNEACERLTAAYLSGDATVVLVHGDYGERGGYVVDFETLEQLRFNGTGRKRPVRGTLGKDPVLPLSKRAAALPSDPAPADSMTVTTDDQDASMVLPQDSSVSQMFEWRDHKGWHLYDPDVSETIAKAMAAGELTQRIWVTGREYDLDLVQMKQCNLISGATRDVR